ncbi:MAG: hypothetical protein UY96_C0017G0043 [Parcubacteria group bacterium GW2011_GWB1_56_8]|nr:MAG: hypothetical protein UY96_C0017G0043 [Parcubacteria group bacterium GW2011_GWB1_56_8]
MKHPVRARLTADFVFRLAAAGEPLGAGAIDADGNVLTEPRPAIGNELIGLLAALEVLPEAVDLSNPGGATSCPPWKVRGGNIPAEVTSLLPFVVRVCVAECQAPPAPPPPDPLEGLDAEERKAIVVFRLRRAKGDETLVAEMDANLDKWKNA